MLNHPSFDAVADHMTHVTRRALLVAGAGGAGALALAACSSSSGTDNPPRSEGTKAPDAAANGGGTALVALSSIEVGGSTSVQLADGSKGIVTRTAADTAVAFSAACTHMGCPVARKGKVLACPCHGSEFDPRTGAVLQGPAGSPLGKVSVTVTGGEVREAG